MTCLADSIWKQVHVNKVNRDEVRRVFCKGIAGDLLLWSNRHKRRYEGMPDLEPIYQENKAVIDSVVDQAFDFADAIQRSIEGKS